MHFYTFSLFSVLVATIAASPIIVTGATSAPAVPKNAMVAKCPPDASFASDGTCVCEKPDQQWDGPTSNTCRCLSETAINKGGKCVCKDSTHVMDPSTGQCTYPCPKGTVSRGANTCACTAPYTGGSMAKSNGECTCMYGLKWLKASGTCDLRCPPGATYNKQTYNCDCPTGTHWGGPPNNVCVKALR